MSRISLVAPSRSLSQEQLQATKGFLEGKGFEVFAPPEMLKPDLYLANNDSQRYYFLKNALEDPKTDIVWALAGGYGATRILHLFKKVKKPKTKKLFVGFSDATAIHLFLNQVWDWPSIHGPGAVQLINNKISPESIETILEQIKNPLASLQHLNLTPFNALAQKNKTLEGIVVGGNLTLLQCSLGTFWQVQGKKKIVLIEEVKERGYRVDRMLTHLYHAGVFHKTKAVVFGDFVDGEEADGKCFVSTVLERFSKDIQVPVFRISKVGHG